MRNITKIHFLHENVEYISITAVSTVDCSLSRTIIMDYCKAGSDLPWGWLGCNRINEKIS